MAPETALRARVTSVASPDFNEQREKTNYKNFTCTFAIKNAHEGRINCIAYVLNGTVITGGADKMLRVWSPLDPKPLGQLEDDLAISHLVRMGKTSQQDVTLLYVASKVIRYLSIKQQKALFLYRDDNEITAITKINGIPGADAVVSFGTANGFVQDFHIKHKQIIRRAKLHRGAKVAAMVSQGNYLVSASPANGLIVIYNYKLHQLHREFSTQDQLIKSPSALHLMKGETLLAVADDRTLSIIDVEKTSVEKHTPGNTQLTRLFRLPLPDTQGGPVFAGATSTGQLKLWSEVRLAGDGKPGHEIDPYRIETLKVLKAGGMQGTTDEITDIAVMPNGAIVACGADKSLSLYEEKKGSDAACACCTLF